MSSEGAFLTLRSLFEDSFGPISKNSTDLDSSDVKEHVADEFFNFFFQFCL